MKILKRVQKGQKIRVMTTTRNKILLSKTKRMTISSKRSSPISGMQSAVETRKIGTLMCPMNKVSLVMKNCYKILLSASGKRIESRSMRNSSFTKKVTPHWLQALAMTFWWVPSINRDSGMRLSTFAKDQWIGNPMVTKDYVNFLIGRRTILWVITWTLRMRLSRKSTSNLTDRKSVV